MMLTDQLEQPCHAIICAIWNAHLVTDRSQVAMNLSLD
jgi:hypothetical protein